MMKAAAFKYQGKTIVIVLRSETLSTIYIDNEKTNYISSTDLNMLKTYSKSLVKGKDGVIYSNSN